MRDEEQRRLLGRFVRSHRERVAPDLPVRRRRTPGLRREELAARAGIGVTWCAWIEQGRNVCPSPETLARLAVALALTAAERTYLFELAGRRDPEAPRADPMAAAPASLRAMVAAMAEPAYGLDRFWNVCCWNAAAAHLFGGWLGEEAPGNLLRFVFTNPAARGLLPDWEQRALRLLAEFRADYGRVLGDPAVTDFTDRLKAESPLFAQGWEAQAVIDREGGVRDFDHPVDGRVAYRQHNFTCVDRPDYKLVVLFAETP
jgi:transcriptional regulator with XRE-family HTH domain